VIALYRKELRSLAPFLFLSFLLMAGDLLYRPFTERLDKLRWESIASYLRPGEGDTFAWILMALSVCLAYSAFPREHEERTIHFLHALPLRRPSLFFAKVLAGMTIAAVAVAMLLASDGAQSLWNTQSFDGGHWRADLALTHVALQLGLAAIAYAHGLLASVLRLFGLLPYVLVLVVASIVQDVFPPAAWISPAELLVARYDGDDLVIAWGPWLVHATVALVVLAAAYGAWMGPADRIGKGLDRAKASALGKVGFGCAGALAVIGLIVLAVVVSEVDVDDDDPIEPEARTIETPSFETRSRTTTHYRFTYPVSHEVRATALIEGADAIHAAVQAELAADAGPVLLADLTEVSGDHLGIASWTHLRVGVVGEPDAERLRHTFAHETVHAFQHRLTDLRQGSAARATGAFAEGSAEHVAQRVVPLPDALRQARVVAAASWVRHDMRSSVLLDVRALRRRYDTTLTYSLGERWTEALVRSCGAGAVGDVLRAMGRDDAPDDLEPRAFWQDTLRAAGCDLESVDDAFATLMDREVEALSEPIERLPRLGGGVSGRDGAAVRIVALLDRDVDPSLRFFVRLRADEDAGDTEAVLIRGRLDETNARRVVYRVSRARIPSRRFQLQLCVLDDPRGWPFCEAWQWGTAP